jgi:MFS family permease
MKSRRPLVVASILLSMFMSAMEATVVATAMPTVVAELKGIEKYGWVSAIYMLAMTITIPIWGKLADLRGRKPVMIAGITVFLAGSIGAGLATSMTMLIAMRLIQGFGAGAMQPVALTIIGDIFTLEERSRIQGIFGAVWGIAAMVGPLIGGIIVRTLSWRWVFYINLAPGLLCIALLVAFFNEKSPSQAPASLDWKGAGALALAMLALLFGTGGTAPVLLLPLSVVLFALFYRIEKSAAAPVLPLSILAHPVIGVAGIAGMLVGAVLMGVITYTPLWVQAVLSGSVTEAGTSVATMLVGWPIASAIGGRLLPRIGFRPLVRAGFSVILMGAIGLIFAIDRSVDSVRLACFILGFGMGLGNTALIIAVQEAASFEERGVATASSIFFRNIGGALAVGAIGSLIAVLIAGNVPEHVLDELLAPHGDRVATVLVQDVAQALAAGMRPAFYVICAIAAFAFAFALSFPKTVLTPKAANLPS